MATSAETDVSKYCVDDATAETFENITNFAKNLVIKTDSKSFVDAETNISKKLGDFLLKYVDSELTDKDICDLLDIVKSYNDTISVTDSEKLQKYFKLDAQSNVQDSIIYVLSEDIIEMCPSLKLYRNNVIQCIIEKIKSINTDNDTVYLEYLKKAISPSSGTDQTQESASENNTGNAAVEIIVDKFIKDNIDSINDVCHAIIESQKIQVFSCEQPQCAKHSASELEKRMIDNGEQLVFFDLKSDDDAVKIKLNELTNSSIVRAQNLDISDSTASYCHIIIIYKELNPKYRSVLLSDISELALCKCETKNSETKFSTIDTIKDSIRHNYYSSITELTCKQLRYVGDDNTLIKDFVDGAGKLSLVPGMTIKSGSNEYTYFKAGFYKNSGEEIEGPKSGDISVPSDSVSYDIYCYLEEGLYRYNTVTTNTGDSETTKNVYERTEIPEITKMEYSNTSITYADGKFYGATISDGQAISYSDIDYTYRSGGFYKKTIDDDRYCYLYTYGYTCWN